MPTLVFATNNSHKLKEAKEILPDSISVVSLREIGCEEELPETGLTLQANSLQKARYVNEKYGLPCFADDTGLEVDALGGAPGVFSARYAGNHATAAENLQKLLRETAGCENRGCRFRTVIALLGIGDPVFFEGNVEGALLESPRGDDGFGYDPIFLPLGEELTFAEMSAAAKNALSHRGEALRRMTEFLGERLKSGF